MSAPTKRYDVVAGRPYTTRDGEEKKHWINVGRATAWDDGGISIELHATPCGNWFDGKLNLFEQKPREDRNTQRQPDARREAPPADDFDQDSVPF